MTGDELRRFGISHHVSIAHLLRGNGGERRREYLGGTVRTCSWTTSGRRRPMDRYEEESKKIEDDYQGVAV